MSIEDKQESSLLRVGNEASYSTSIRQTPWVVPSGRGEGITVLASYDDGRSWMHVASAGCSKTKSDHGDGFPGLRIDLSAYRGALIKTVLAVDESRLTADLVVESK